MRLKNNTKKGFTLVEMLIAVSLFVVVVTISIGAVLTILDANRRAQSSKTVVDNLNLSIEDMVRIVRFGSNYHCGASGSLTSPQNCNTGATTDTLLAVTFNGSIVVYRLNGESLQRSSDGGSTYTDITASNAKIQYLRFYVFGTPVGDTEQPYVVAVIKGYVGNKATAQSTFSIQTVMSQRSLDL